MSDVKNNDERQYKKRRVLRDLNISLNIKYNCSDHADNNKRMIIKQVILKWTT